MVRLHPVDEAMARRTKRFTPDIAALSKEDSMCHLPGGSAAFVRPRSTRRRRVSAVGRTYGSTFWMMLSRSPGKLQLYLAAWALTPAERRSSGESRSEHDAGVVLRAGYV